MYDVAEIFRSVEHIWVLWILSSIAVGSITWWGLSRISWSALLRMHREEEGSAYTVAYAMVIPVYVLTMCVVVETTLILVAKYGTLYSGYAAARTAVVWLPHAQPQVAEAKIREAAVQAFVPFSNGIEKNSAAQSASGDRNIERYIDAYKEHVEKPKSLRYIRAKYLYAEQALQVRFEKKKQEKATEPWQYDVVVNVEYRFAFHIPIIGRLIGQSGPDGYFFPVGSRMRLTGEAPQNKDQSLGIRYGTP